jgi:two-component system cell cycle sensor histidine kinase/response regulator CckA
VLRTVLLTEDEESLRNLLQSVLQRDGYEVITASDGSEALRCVRERSGPIDILLTDVMMPVIDGFTLANVIRSEHPETHVLFMTGQVDLSIPREFDSESNIIWKPFNLCALLKRLRELSA